MGDATDDQMAELLDQAFIPVSADAGRFLYSLVRATNGGTVIEFGTSFGISTIYLASAIRDRGAGTVITTTNCTQGKAQKARENIRAAGLLDYVDIREGDALQTLGEIKSGVSLLFSGRLEEAAHLPVLRLLEPALEPGGRGGRG